MCYNFAMNNSLGHAKRPAATVLTPVCHTGQNGLTYYKYPKTMHLPWSPGLQIDDRVIDSLSAFQGQRVIVTEKMDGENTTIYSDGKYHARSIDSKKHPSRSIIGALTGQISHQLPLNWRLCGENLYAKHSIFYQQLSAYFLVFSIWEAERCLAWDETKAYTQLLGLDTVPVLYDGLWDEELIKSLYQPQKPNGDHMEGYVVRLASEFKLHDFPTVMAKFVRKGHVQTDDHWLNQPLVPNQLLIKNG